MGWDPGITVLTLKAVLTAHQRMDAGSCMCGWNVLGASHADHVAKVFANANEYVHREPS